MQIEFMTPSLAQLKKWARLDDAKVRREEGAFLAEGVKVVEELLKSDWQIKALLVMPEKIKFWQKIDLPQERNIPAYQLKRTQWEKIGQDREPEGIMALVEMKAAPTFSSWLKKYSGHVLILDDINNPLNLGALARSAQWFGFNSILLSANSVDHANPKAIRASMGSLFHLTMIPEIDLMDTLPEIRKHFFVIGSDVHEGVPPHPVQKNVALILGNESHGLPETILKMTDEKWSIPGSGMADSLSLPQAAAIMMYECTKK
ncbi:rna methyltransferase, trmh family [hydrocarbon metagenome]|uniref:Rna methyltransferase, trmh family n=1 Tax=hydrocarbon metagenome TaxID=938273 RepID=A0A0W8FN54_9ZZZZ